MDTTGDYPAELVTACARCLENKRGVRREISYSFEQEFYGGLLCSGCRIHLSTSLWREWKRWPRAVYNKSTMPQFECNSLMKIERYLAFAQVDIGSFKRMVREHGTDTIR